MNYNTDYWINRHKKLGGERTVGHQNWSHDTYFRETEKIWNAVFNQAIFFWNNGKILDYGCGIGRFLHYMLKDLKPKSYTGIDIVPDVIQANRERWKGTDNVEFYLMDVTSKIWDQKQYDLACTFFVLQHIVDDELLQRTLELIYNSLKADSYFIAIENVSKNPDKDYIKFRNLDTYTTLFKAAGFNMVKESWVKKLGTGENHCLYICHKR